MNCTAKIRPFRPVNETEVTCERSNSHIEHLGTILDYAYPGSQTVLNWQEDDRRTFRGTFRNCTVVDSCLLPNGHRTPHEVGR